MDLNEAIFRFLNQPGNPVLDAFMIGLGIAGYVYFTALWAVPLWFLGRKRLAVDILVLMLIDLVLAGILKSVFALPRPASGALLPPFDRDGYSFPSAHATRAFAAALLLSLSTKDWRWRGGLFAYAVAMGIQRIYVGVHWPSDVLAGAILGMAWAYGLVLVTRHPGYASARDRAVDRIQWALDKLHIPRGRPESR